MSPPEAPNPERRSYAATMCFGVGAGLMTLSWFLGFGAAMTAAIAGEDSAFMIVGLGGAMVALIAVLGFLIAVVGGVWMLVRVIADQHGSDEERRYRDIDR